MGVDHSTILSSAGPGRKSVRITSKKTWTHGLFLMDAAHMPGGACGSWPACEFIKVFLEEHGEVQTIDRRGRLTGIQIGVLDLIGRMMGRLILLKVIPSLV